MQNLLQSLVQPLHWHVSVLFLSTNLSISVEHSSNLNTFPSQEILLLPVSLKSCVCPCLVSRIYLTPKGVTFGAPPQVWFSLFICWYVRWYWWVGPWASVVKSSKACWYPDRLMYSFVSKIRSYLWEKWTSKYSYLSPLVAHWWMKVSSCRARLVTLFALSFLGLFLLVTGNCSPGRIPFVMSKRSGWVNIPRESLSLVTSPSWCADMFPVIVLGIEVCRFWYTVFHLSSARTTWADAVALRCVYACLMHSSSMSSRAVWGLQWYPDSLHDMKWVSLQVHSCIFSLCLLGFRSGFDMLPWHALVLCDQWSRVNLWFEESFEY